MSSVPTPSKLDRTALQITIVLGAAAIVFTVVRAILRLLEIVPNRNVPVLASFADTPATMPIGPGGAPVVVGAQQVVLYVSDMPPITLWSLVLCEVVYALAAVATVVLVCLVIRNIIGGRAFAAETVGLVGAAMFVVLGGWLLTWLFTTMGANGGASALAGEPGLNTNTPVDPIVPFAIASLGALAAAFQIGHKLQREAEGLV
ncbi:MAG: hypothetical protein ABI435_07910 [Pseudolysinimonas sp.]